ncbi:MAG: DUF979 family protein, partial [Rhodanobacteraceae bacterium]
MLRIEYVYWLIGALLLVAGAYNLRERRWSMAAFWSVLACPFLFGDEIVAAAAAGSMRPAQTMGIGVIALGMLAARGGIRRVDDDDAARERRRLS